MKKISITDALFSKVQQRVLSILYGQPDSVFYTNEIIRLTQSGTEAVRRELEKLTASGLVIVTHVGNQKLYQANTNTPIFKELRISIATLQYACVRNDLSVLFLLVFYIQI